MSYEFILCMLKLVLSKKKSTHQPLVNLMRFRDCVHSDQKLPDQLRLIRRPKSGHVDGENGLISKRFFWQFVFWNSFCQTFLLLKAIAILELVFPIIFQLYSQYIAMIFPWYLGFCEKFCTSLPAPGLLPASACRGAGTEGLKIFVAALKNLWWCGFWGGRHWRPWGPRMA